MIVVVDVAAGVIATETKMRAKYVLEMDRYVIELENINREMMKTANNMTCGAAE